MTSGEIASIAPEANATGMNHLGIERIVQSVMTDSNVHSANVTKTTSKVTSNANQKRMMPASSSGCSNAAVPRTPEMMTGTVIGYNNTGSSTSRLRARTSIAAKSVPTAANPVVPVASIAASQNGC